MSHNLKHFIAPAIKHSNPAVGAEFLRPGLGAACRAPTIHMFIHRSNRTKTTEFMHSSHVDAAMVILHNVGETAARQILEDCMKIISE